MVILSGLDDVLSESSVPKCEEYYAWFLGLLFFFPLLCLSFLNRHLHASSSALCYLLNLFVRTFFSAYSVLHLNCRGHFNYFTLNIFLMSFVFRRGCCLFPSLMVVPS